MKDVPMMSMYSIFAKLTDAYKEMVEKVKHVNVEIKKLLISRCSLVIHWDPAAFCSALKYVDTSCEVQKQ